MKQIFNARLLPKDKLIWLFLICIFPIHMWGILIFFSNMGWLLMESGVWFVIGVFSYQLILAFLEALFVFMGLLFLLLWLPKKWTDDTKILFLGNIAWLSWLGLILVQYLTPGSLDPMTIMFTIGMVTMLLIILVQFFSLKNKSIASFHLEIFDRIKVMSYLFWGTDFLALIIVLIRNIFWTRLT